MENVFEKEMNILVIDDEIFSRTVISRFFSEFGNVFSLTAGNGADGLSVLAEKKDEIAIVICDFNMPVMNGLEFLKAVRSGEAGVRHDLPVIMLTGHSDFVLVRGALALDIDAFVVKPVTKQVLLDRVKKALAAGNELAPAAHYASIDIDSAASIVTKGPRGPADELMVVQTGGDAPGKAEREILLKDVTPPVTLSRDLRAPDGEMLISIGTALNHAFLERLLELCDPADTSIWIESTSMAGA